jgi:hypothetical protein
VVTGNEGKRTHRRALAPGIYGTIICGSVMVAVDPTGSIGHVVAVVVVTVLIYWLAERYSELLARRMRGERVSATELRSTLRTGWPMVQASYTPLLVPIGAGLLGADTATAVSAAVFYTTALLFVLGWLAGRRGGQSGWGLVGTETFIGGLGIVMVILKLALH